MIPHQLQLKNFLSYGPEEQTINFSDYHLICLTGKNGHGKSALLDAITWAIWGQARKTTGTSKADLGLVHLGQKHMFIRLDFEINGQRYRVRREYVKTQSKPYASLDFGIIQSENETISLTDKTIKATQAKIEKTIGVSYDAFVNSTFLRQGQANEFSKKSPKERKEILANILQLNQFEDRKKEAIAKAKEFHQEYTTQRSIYDRITQEIEELKDAQVKVQEIKKQIKVVEKEKNSILLQQKKINQQKTFFLKQQHEKKSLLDQKVDFESQFAQIKNELNTIAKLWHTTEKKLSNLDNANYKKDKVIIEKKLKELQKLMQEQLSTKEQYLQLKEKQARIEQDNHQKTEKQLIEVQTNIIQQEAEHVQISKQIIQHNQEKDDLKKDIDQSNEEITFHKKMIEQHKPHIKKLSHKEDIFDQKKQLYQKLCAEGTMLKKHLDDLKQKAHLTEDNKQHSCPLCDQNLSTPQKKFISNKINKDIVNSETTLIKIKQDATILKEQLVAEHSTITILKEEQDKIGRLSAQMQEQQKEYAKKEILLKKHKQTIDILTKQEKSISEKKIELKKILEAAQKEKSKILESTSYKQLCSNINSLEKKLKTNKNIQKELIKTEQDLELIATKESLALNFEQEKASQLERRSTLITLTKSTYTIQQKLISVTSLYEKIQIDQSQKKLEKEEKETEQHLTSLNNQQNNLLIQKGSFEQKEKKLITLQKEMLSLQKTIKKLYDEIKDYQEIARALGKDGIQALLIEEAIPEIEQEANVMLARLTNNQTQIFIESLRDLKKGGSKETLDIKISDPCGLRPYELFSGGEAFRIDFALRIGISKLLARRAGTSLQTIFIDEGFGSQDEDGLQAIMDNIYKIQDSFAKVIIVSHLPEMKEQFPVQFIITKKESGSVVTIQEQG